MNATRVVNSETTVSRIVDDLSPMERRTYSYARLLRHIAQGGPKKAERCLELEVSEALSRELGVGPEIGSMYVPLSLEPVQERSGLDTKSGAAGGYLGGVAVSNDLATLLRQKNLLLSLGAQLLSLDRAAALPVQTAGSTAVWLQENSGADISDTDSTFGQRVAYPHELLITTSLSLRLLMQTGGVIENFVRNDLAQAIAVALDAAGVNGSGLANEPTGILKTTGIGDVAGGGNGLIPTFGHIVNLEQAVATANADLGSLAYLSTIKMRSKLRQVEENSGGQMIWRPAPWGPGQSMVNSYPAFATAACPSTLSKGSSVGVAHAILFGDWSQCLLVNFGAASLLVDPYKLKKQAEVEVCCYLSCDVLVRRPESFSAMQDGLIS